MKKIFIGLICVFALSLLFSYKSYAYNSDYALCEYTIESNYLSGQNLCNEYLSDIVYVVIDFGVDSSEHAMSITYNTFLVNNSNGRNIFLWSFSSPLSSSVLTGVTGVSDEYPILISFYDEWPSDYNDCPEPEPSEPCPDPEENSRFIQVVLDAFWKYHMVFAGAVAGLIAIFVVYRIIKGMLR